ncbi:hypothetical protein EPN90_02415 [Patescibacteria group bacterium]|nr:MAG: hypothetical protein EPN90_02415 [Patescibacteria group bacterium]
MESDKQNSAAAPRWRAVVKAVSEFFHVPVEEIRGRSRQGDIAEARHMAMFLMREDCQTSLPRIGGYFGRDHSTVLYAVQKVAGNLARDQKLREAVATIRDGYRALESEDQGEALAAFLTPENVDAEISGYERELRRLRGELQAARRKLQIARRCRAAFRSGGVRANGGGAAESATAKAPANCRECRREKKIRAGGLCAACYRRVHSERQAN